MGWKIIVNDIKQGRREDFYSDLPRIRIGRLQEVSDLTLPFPEISRRQALLYWERGCAYLQDLESKNGCYLIEDGEWVRMSGCIALDVPVRVRLGHWIVLEVWSDGVFTQFLDEDDPITEERETSATLLSFPKPGARSGAAGETLIPTGKGAPVTSGVSTLTIPPAQSTAPQRVPAQQEQDYSSEDEPPQSWWQRLWQRVREWLQG